MNAPIVSIIMPAYNVEKYIAFAIESVKRQTFNDWELIIINDFSSDNTKNIVTKYINEKIKLINLDINSGSAYIPREVGVNLAKGKWIVNLDADDYIEDDYLYKLLSKAVKNEADIVAAQMVSLSESGDVEGIIAPRDEFNFNQCYSNRDALNLTLPKWAIGMNGALVKKSIWLKALSQYCKTKKKEIHDDENLSRILIINADNVCVEKATYYLRKNPTSVTRKFNINSFSWMKSNYDLKLIIKDTYGGDSEEYRKVLFYDCECYKSTMSLVFDIRISYNECKLITNQLKKWHDMIDWDFIVLQEDTLKTRVYSNFLLSMIYKSITQRKIVFLKYFIKKFLSKISEKITNNRYYRWYITRHQREKKISCSLKKYYSSFEDDVFTENVICIYDGTVQSGGLADRLKGIIGTYSIAKEKKIPFKLYFKSPFPLEDFLCPNSYDWTVNSDLICKDISKIDIIVLDNTQDSDYQIAKQKKYLENKIRRNGKQKHVYTNASFSYNLDYSKLFNELFKPSERLQKSITREMGRIGSNYISISCRFLDLLGDFNETFGYGETLLDFEKEILLRQIDKVIYRLHKENINKKILINSDSVTFLNRYKHCEYAYVADGNVTHIDAKQDEYSYEKYEKTFLDFMLIANADSIYLIKSKIMHKSGYPFAASKIYGKRYEIIEI